MALQFRSRGEKCRALRGLLSDGRWHTADELRQVAGWRFGARLYELRHGEDGGAVVVVLTRFDRGEYLYRQVNP